jgi:hypothetical protein
LKPEESHFPSAWQQVKGKPRLEKNLRSPLRASILPNVMMRGSAVEDGTRLNFADILLNFSEMNHLISIQTERMTFSRLDPFLKLFLNCPIQSLFSRWDISREQLQG